MNNLTGLIIGAAMKVHTALGPGLLESGYQVCFDYELRKMNLRVERQKPLPVVYEGIRLDCGYRLDFIIENTVVIEIKSVENILPIHVAQLLSYLRLSELQVGLLINFNVVHLRHGIRRIVN